MATSSNRHDLNADLGRLLSDNPPDIVELTLRLRDEILSVIPHASERVYFGWRGIGFHHPTAGYICAVFPSEDDVRLGFEHGHILYDPRRLLEGTGRWVRYLTVPEWSKSPFAAVHDFIQQALHHRWERSRSADIPEPSNTSIAHIDAYACGLMNSDRPVTRASRAGS
jgi:hypothetical protein